MANGQQKSVPQTNAANRRSGYTEPVSSPARYTKQIHGRIAHPSIGRLTAPNQRGSLNDRRTAKIAKALPGKRPRVKGRKGLGLCVWYMPAR